MKRPYFSRVEWKALLVIALFWNAPQSLKACPWCAQIPAMKPTVEAGTPDPGGKFFGKSPDSARIRRYFIAAEHEFWDFLPDGKDMVMGNPIPAHLITQSKSSKKRFFQYTDDTFSAKVLPTERLGIMGPVMRGVVGDYIVVTLLNRLDQPVSLHPHGVRYDKDSEGSSYLTSRGLGASIAPNARFTYVWKLDKESGPHPGEPSSKPWLYHSHVSGDEEINAGLSGFIIVTDPARTRKDGTPRDVDREMVLLFQNYDESGISESDEYAKTTQPDGESPATPLLMPPPTWASRQESKELAMRHAINGRIFGNLKGLEMVEGERVRWYLFSLGIDPDVHTVHWHGERVRDPAGSIGDVAELMPGTMKSVDMATSNPGDWMIHCHVGDHMMEGMYGNFTVFPEKKSPPCDQPFFGVGSALESVKWLSAEGNHDRKDFRFKGRCRVSAYANLSVWTTLVGISVGRIAAEARLDQSGVGRDGGAMFQIVNADPMGIVRPEFIELEITLQGPAWAEAVKPRLEINRTVNLPLRISVNKVVHDSRINLKVSRTGLRMASGGTNGVR